MINHFDDGARAINSDGIAEIALAEIADLLHAANDLKSAIKLVPDSKAQALMRSELNRRKSHLWLCAVFVWFIAKYKPERTDIIRDTYTKALDSGKVILDAVNAFSR